MSTFSNITEQNLISLHNLAQQQKNKRAPNFKNRIFKQTHDIKIAESLSLITKKLDEVKESTQKLGEIAKESNTPRLAKFSTKVSISFLRKPASCFFSFIWYISPSFLLLIPPQKTCRTQTKKPKKLVRRAMSTLHLVLEKRIDSFLAEI